MNLNFDNLISDFTVLLAAPAVSKKVEEEFRVIWEKG